MSSQGGLAKDANNKYKVEKQISACTRMDCGRYGIIANREQHEGLKENRQDDNLLSAPKPFRNVGSLELHQRRN